MANDRTTPSKSLPIKDAELKEQYHRVGPYMLLSKNAGIKEMTYDGTNVLIVMKDRTVVIHGSAFKGMELA